MNTLIVLHRPSTNSWLEIEVAVKQEVIASWLPNTSITQNKLVSWCNSEFPGWIISNLDEGNEEFDSQENYE